MGKTYKYNKRGKVKAAGTGELSPEERGYTGGRKSYSSGERLEDRRGIRKAARLQKESTLHDIADVDIDEDDS